jgi:ABC-2 type transport system permease protein
MTAVAAGVLGYAIIIVFALALGLALSVSQVFLRDTGNIVAVVNNFIRFGVPMMYPFSIVADRFRGHVDLYLANPIADAVLLVQRCFWVPTTSDPEAVAQPFVDPVSTPVAAMPDHLFLRGFVALAVAFVLLVIAQRIFAKFENRMPERL